MDSVHPRDFRIRRNLSAFDLRRGRARHVFYTRRVRFSICRFNKHEKSMIEREKERTPGFAKKKRKGKPFVVGVTNRHRREIEHESSSIPSRALVTGGCVCVAVRRIPRRGEKRAAPFFSRGRVRRPVMWKIRGMSFRTIYEVCADPRAPSDYKSMICTPTSTRLPGKITLLLLLW